jgi:hypothetical protein
LTDEAANERLTVEVMKMVADHRRNNRDSIEGWLNSLRETASLKPLNVLEHSALVYVYQNRILHDLTTPEILRSLEDTLAQSYSRLTGKSASGNGWQSPLPRSVVRKSGETSKIFHDAVFAEIAANSPAKSGLKGWYGQIRKYAGSEKAVTSVISLLAIGGMFFDSTRPYSGLLFGLAQASLNEHFIHIGVGHANTPLVRAFRKYGGKAGQFAEEIAMTHKLHHQIVKKNYGAVVLTPEQTEVAESALSKLSQALVRDRMIERLPEKSVTEIEAMPEFKSEVNRIITSTRNGNYGINGTWKGATSMMVTNAPWYLLNFALYRATGSEAFLITSNMTLGIMTLQSLYSHRYLHINPSDQAKVSTNWLQNMYMKSPLGRLQQRLHFVHHESPYPMESTQNGAIMAGSVSDRLINKVQHPSVKNLVDYYFQGFLPRLQSPFQKNEVQQQNESS